MEDPRNLDQSSESSSAPVEPVGSVPRVPKYQPILPKLTVARRRVSHSRIPANDIPYHRTCRVAACRRSKCSLQSHRWYNVRHGHDGETSSSQSRSEPTGKETKLRQITSFQQAPDMSIIEGGVDGLPVLPLDGLEEPSLRKLFHYFFTRHYEWMHRICAPPPNTDFQKQQLMNRKQHTLTAGLSGPVFCLHLIAAAHHQTAIRNDQYNSNPITRILHNKLMVLLREKLNNFAPSEIAELILVILTLVQFDIAADRLDTLPIHRRAVDHLISSQGGVHNMARILPFIYILDRMLAMFTDSPPRYAPRLNRDFRRPTLFPHIYGSHFEPSGDATFGEDIRAYCYDACRAIEVVEGECLSFAPDDPLPPKCPDLHYFYFLKERLLNEFTYLNSELAGRDDLARCVLLATKVVDYIVLQDNFLISVSIHQATCILDILKKQNLDQMWSTNRAALRWILFVMASMPAVWNGRGMALRLLKHELNRQYSGSVWPDGWTYFELENVRAFVWSDTRLDKSFSMVCNELVNSTSPVTLVKRIPNVATHLLEHSDRNIEELG